MSNRRGLLLAAAGLCLVPRAAHADEACTRYEDAIVADLGLHVIDAAYDHTIDCFAVLQIGGGLYVPWTVTTDVLGLGGGDRVPDAEAMDVAGGVVRARAFLFPAGTAPVGFWISPFYQLGFVRAIAAPDDRFGVAQASGVSVGGTFVVSGWLVALGAGAQLHMAALDGSVAAPGFALPGPTLDLNTGYAF